MTKLTKGNLYLYGKPNERLIAIGLCKRFKCNYNYDEATGYLTYTGDSELVSEVKQTYNTIITKAYKALAFAQARSDLSHTPCKTLNSEFMQAFAAMTYSITTGEPYMFVATTEAQRAGLRAVGKHAS